MERSPVCVLLFSGGRDSTIAAARLAQHGYEVILATVISDHLVGLAAVKTRLRELQPVMSHASKWVVVRELPEPTLSVEGYHQTCLPCHRGYLLTALSLAKRYKARAVAFGYVKYQGTWPEQTPYAIEKTKELVQGQGLDYLLPAYPLASKEEADKELLSLGLTAAALEQKCTQQQFNRVLTSAELRQAVDLWQSELVRSVSAIVEHPADVVEELAHLHWLQGESATGKARG